jgi:starch synthase (maltosyl-transferring)
MPTTPAPKTPPPRIRITNVKPVVDCGRHPAKRSVGDRVDVQATVFRDGHEILGAQVLYRGPGEKRWRSAPLELLWNDLFIGSFEVDAVGRWEFRVEGWTDRAATWRDELRRKVEAGEEDLTSELKEGEALLGLKKLTVEKGLASTKTDKHGLVQSDPLELDVDRPLGRFGAWYELFPRSFGGFEGVERVLPQLAELGFDVVYFPPIHPIGTSWRKGRNNTLPAKPGDPGSPWAIGSELGGHDAIDPGLGTLADFDRLVAAATALDLEISLDFAIQCSPDHPWLKEHPDWFHHRPDGTIKYAENPPKKYQDIVNVDWECEDWFGLWQALRDVFLHWMAHGIRIFRLDNPHTKPLAFWEWVIAEVRKVDPGVIFLAEAFTKPAMMHELAKTGMNQSYSYFTWRNERWDLQEYMTELATVDAEYFRPNFFVNTPDILTGYLADGGRPAFEARLVLAATLSPAYGVYSGYENVENVPVRPGSEEYLDSEKYELKTRTIEGPLLPLIQKLNEIRRANRSLQRIDNVTFLETANDQLVAYAKRDDADTVIVCVNIDPAATSEGLLDVPAALDLPQSFVVQDLLTDDTYAWQVGGNYVALPPGGAHVMHVR